MSSVQVFDSKRWDHSVRARFQDVTERMAAMATLGLTPVHVWESDDSAGEYRFIELMMRYAHDAGGRVIRLETFGVTQMHCDCDKSQTATVISSGKYMYVAE